MIDVFNPKPEREEVIEGLNLGDAVRKVRRTTESERAGFPFIKSVDYVIELGDASFPTKRVYAGFNGDCFALGDGDIFVDFRESGTVVKHEMIHSWYSSLTAEQQKDLLDTYMRHEPDFLGGRKRMHSNPLLSFRDILAHNRRYNSTPEALKHPLLEHVSSLEKAVAMKEGEFVDHIYTRESDGKNRLSRYVKTNDTYRGDDTLDTTDEGFAPWLANEREEFLELHETANEYLAHGAMHHKPTMPEPIYAAMKRNGFDNNQFEEIAQEIMCVIKQLRNIDTRYISVAQEADLQPAVL
jgi:hypothetical protein